MKVTKRENGKTSADTGYKMRLASFERKRSGPTDLWTDRRTDGRTDKPSYKHARTHQKMKGNEKRNERNKRK